MDSANSIEAIAKRAGLSKTTVSMVLNGKAQQYRISRKTQLKVEKLAKQLNYSPNISARNLRLKTTRTIALVIPDLGNYFFAQLALCLERVCRVQGYLLQISCSEDNSQLEQEIVDNFLAKSVDGLIIASVHTTGEFVESVAQRLPVVLIDRRIEGVACSWVESNHYQSAMETINLLLAQKPREVAYIGGISALSSSQERLRAYKQVLKKNKFKIQRKLIVESDYQISSGFQAMDKIIKHCDRLPDTLFTASFTLLEGALQRIKQGPETLPAKFTIATFDDHPLLDYANIKIHSIKQDYEKIASDAFSALQKKLGGDAKLSNITVPAAIIAR